MMADPKNKTAVFERRARELARQLDDHAPRRLHARVLVVTCGRERYGLPAENLREVVPATKPTALPGLPAWLPGVVAIHGAPICVVDLPELLGVGATGERRYFAVVEGAPGAVALHVDEVPGFRDVLEEELADSVSRSDDPRLYPVRAMTTDLVSIIDVERLLMVKGIRVDQ
jgi:chemotaxis signal transduction protein